MNHNTVSSPILSPPGINKTTGSGMLLAMSPVPIGDGALSSALMGTTLSSPAPSAGGGSNQSTATMANTKEKTPMCLINELARFNKIEQVQHQYRLVDESGPAHKKTFSVVLKLDEEEYTAAGPSIKKAQHAAAGIALEKTLLKHPPAKNQQKHVGPVTPTVELNALAMKRGELACYQVIETSRPHYLPNFNFRGMYNQRYHYPKIPPTYYVSLKVGKRQFYGEGRTTRVARHAAADEALKALRDLPLPDNVKKRPEIPVKPEGGGSEQSPPSDPESDLKSPISLVHELALKCWLPVSFEVVRESGPPHMRNFITRCSVGDLSTEGEGNGKKISKKRAAEAMLEELRKLPPPLAPATASTQQKVKKKPIAKKKSRNLIKADVLCKEQKADPQYGQGINPISRLIQIQQAKKEKEPLYTVYAERGEPRQREFVMQCALGDLVTSGSGPNKKTAKRNAAESMLQLMGYSRPGKPTKPEGTLLQGQEVEKSRSKVSYFDIDAMAAGDKIDGEGKLGRQLVPGLLLMPPEAAFQSDLNRAPGGPVQNQDMVNKLTFKTTSAIAKELLDTGVSPTAEAIRRSGHKSLSPQKTARPKQQLMYLADVLGFQVHFTDFPKGAKMEYLSLVSLSTNPPQVSHGAGLTIEASHDQAAQTALRALAELGLDSGEGGDKDLTGAGMTSKNGMHLSGVQSSAPKLANSPTADLGGNLKAGAAVTAKDTH